MYRLSFRTLVPLTLAATLAAPAGAQTKIQILHASDLEGAVEAIENAPNFAAVVEALEADAADGGFESILLSAGDNYIPGPFFSAAADFALRQPLRDALGNQDAREGSGRVDAAIMNLIGFDASALGNHEFDAGTSLMSEIVGTDIRDSDSDTVLDESRWLGTDFPYLSSNLDFSGDGSLAGLYTPQILASTAFASPLSDLDAAAAAPKLARAAIVERNGESFGIVGATTPLLDQISSPGATGVRNPGAGTNDMTALASIIQPVIDELLGMGVDKIILVSHLQQIALEQQLVPLLAGVDIAVAGGSDTLLADADDVLRVGDVAGGSYPIVTQNADGDPALVVSTDGQYKYVGRLVVEFDAAGIVVPSSLQESVNGAFATDASGVDALWGGIDPFAVGTKGERVRQLTDAVADVVLAKDGNIFGKTAVFLEGRRTAVRTQETNMGNLTADANLAEARLVDTGVVASIKNGGGIRAEIGAIDGTTGELLPPAANPLAGKSEGDVSQLDIENTLRFNNGLTLLTVTAEQLLQALEHAVAESDPGATPGRFPQIGGLRFSFDPERPAGDRVRSVALVTADGNDDEGDDEGDDEADDEGDDEWDDSADDEVLVLGGEIVGDPLRPIRIVTLNFLASGGDGYPFGDFVAAAPSFANRVDLLGESDEDLNLNGTIDAPAAAAGGVAAFAAAGSEQDAIAEYLAAMYAAVAFDEGDTPFEVDERIQNLLFRDDSIAPWIGGGTPVLEDRRRIRRPVLGDEAGENATVHMMEN